MGRYQIKEDELKEKFGASAMRKVIELLGKTTCKEIAENAVNKEYEKRLKNK